MLTTNAEKTPSTLHDDIALSTSLLNDKKLELAFTDAHQLPTFRYADLDTFDSLVDEVSDCDPTLKATFFPF